MVPNPNTVTKDIGSLSLRSQGKSQTQVLNDLYKFKQKYKTYGIYIFECNMCSLFIMLHQKVCPHCKTKNIYFDSTLEVNEQIDKDVMAGLVIF